MGIKWEEQINVLDVKRGNVSITLRRIDDTDPDNIKVLNVCRILDGLIDTTERKQQAIAELKRQYQEQEKMKDADDAVVGTFDRDIISATKDWGTS